MSQVRYIGLRIVQTVVLLFLILTFLFFFFRSLPGSFIDIMMYSGASPEAAAALRAKWGLNQPLYVQYIRYMANFVSGDIGQSLMYRIPVWDFVKMKIFNSFILVAPAVTLTYLLGSVIGGILGSRRGKKTEKYGLVPLILTGSSPAFFTGIVLIIVIAGWMDLVPTGGMFGFDNPYTTAKYPWWRPYLTKDFALHYVLPFTTVVVRYLYLPSLIMRSSIVEVSGQDFFFYHRMTGLPGSRRLYHLMKHASLPVITIFPISMTRAIGGLVILEIVFNWPGIGFALVQAVFARDYPVVQFVFFLVAAFVVVSNFTIDILYGFIDPRVTVGEK